MPRPNPSWNSIARAYGITRQRLHKLRAKHGLTVSDFIEPENIFERLLNGYRCPLRTRLISAAFRDNVRQTLKSFIQ